MSYCVNCGVELDVAAKECPLCRTPVINPYELRRENSNTFPKDREPVEEIRRNDFGWLVSMVSLATAVTCGLLNWLVFNQNRWSLAVIGGCVLFWVFMIPFVIYHKWSPCVYLLLDGVTMIVYLYFIAQMVDKFDWLFGLGIPIVVWITAMLELFALAVLLLSKSFLSRSLYFFTILGIGCCGLELLIRNFLDLSPGLHWSAVVLTICAIMDIAIVTTLSQRKLRNALQRRLHF